jgi:hypothetical protein
MKPATRRTRHLFILEIFLAFAFLAIGAASQAAAAGPSQPAQKNADAGDKVQLKVGVLPFVDNTGSGGANTGAEIGRAVQAEMAHSTDLEGRVLKLDDGTTAEDVDAAKAVEIGRARKVDCVLVGTVLEATTDESNQNVSGPSIFGQNVSGSKRSMKSVVTLQGDLYSTTTGKKIESIRITGKATSNKVGADASTTLGSMGSGGVSFDNSTLGKAFHDAVTNLVKKVVADEAQLTPYKP